MAKHKYRIASEEGANRYQQEVGTETELDLSVSEQKAVVAAGWVEQLDVEDDSKTKKKEG
jgi:hypothetical protein